MQDMASHCHRAAHCLRPQTTSVCHRRPLRLCAVNAPRPKQPAHPCLHSCQSRRLQATCKASAKKGRDAVISSTDSTSHNQSQWDPDDYMNSYDSDDYDDSTYFELQSKRGSTKHQAQTRLFDTAADRRLLEAQGLRTLELEAAIAEVHPLMTGLVFLWRRFWFRLLKVGQTVSVAPLETYKAVTVTSGAAKEVVQQICTDSIQQARHAVEEARAVAERSRAKADLMEDRPCPEDFWGKVQWWWERPPLKRMRTTVSMAQWSVKLPALMALVATQVGLLASQVSLPMLAPLLLGSGMLFRSIKSNASFLFPRISLVVVLMWVLWFANSVVQNTVHYLQRQGRLDHRVSAAVITGSELFTMLGAAVIMLSALGVNVSGLLLPAGICLAFASKDLAHNFLAGFFLFAVQPFRLGDRIAVRSQPSDQSAIKSAAPTPGWYEGTCEAVDLRYTIIKNGRQRLFMPNSHFLTSEFMVMDHDSKPRSRKHSSSTGQPAYGPPPQSDRTRPLGPIPSGAYGRWDQEIERQRMQAATRRAATGPAPSQQPGPMSLNQSPAAGNGDSSGHQHPSGVNGTDRHVSPPDMNGAGQQQTTTQHLDDVPVYPNPYRGIPGYYSYPPTVQEQYWFDYNRYHPYWAQSSSQDGDESIGEYESTE